MFGFARASRQADPAVCNKRSKNMVSAAGASSAAAQLAGRRAIVATAGMPIGRMLAKGLARHGARVIEIASAFSSKAQAEAALADAAREIGGADLIVHAAATPSALAVRALDTLSPDDWQAAVHRSFLATLFCLQAAHAQPARRRRRSRRRRALHSAGRRCRPGAADDAGGGAAHAGQVGRPPMGRARHAPELGRRRGSAIRPAARAKPPCRRRPNSARLRRRWVACPSRRPTWPT